MRYKYIFGRVYHIYLDRLNHYRNKIGSLLTAMCLWNRLQPRIGGFQFLYEFMKVTLWRNMCKKVTSAHPILELARNMNCDHRTIKKLRILVRQGEKTRKRSNLRALSSRNIRKQKIEAPNATRKTIFDAAGVPKRVKQPGLKPLGPLAKYRNHKNNLH